MSESKPESAQDVPWPPERWPTASEWAEWIVGLDRERLLQAAERIILHAQTAARCVDKAHDDELRRARFHENHNYDRWKAAEAVIDALGIEEWAPADGDRRCQECGRPNPVWFADSATWNEIVGSEAGVLCPTCFALKAPEGITWRLCVAPVVPPEWALAADRAER